MSFKSDFQKITGSPVGKVAVLSLNMNAMTAETAKYATGIVPGNITSFSLYGADYNPDTESADPNSFIFVSQLPGFQQKFSALIVGASLFAFNTDWHRTLIDLAANMVATNGYLLIPRNFVSNKAAVIGLSHDKLTEWMGADAEEWPGGFYGFKVSPRSVTPSVLEWLSNRGPTYIQYLAEEFAECDEAHFKDLAMMTAPYSFAYDAEDFPVIPRDNLDVNHRIPRAKFGEAEYLGLGTGQKYAGIKTVLSLYNQAESGFRLVDHGTAAGLIPMQSILEEDTPVSELIMIEPLKNFRSMAYDLLSYQGPELRKKTTYVYRSSEDYEYDTPVGFVSFFHMFFLISEDVREKVFKRAYDALLPGGTILLWEIPKTEQSASNHYYDKMMTWDDLESMCAPYDTVAYLNPRYMSEIDPKDFVNKPIIRVIKKPR